MKIGDNVIIVSKYGEFENNIEGRITSFYGDDKALVMTDSGHEWAIDRKDLRVITKQRHSTWKM